MRSALYRSSLLGSDTSAFDLQLPVEYSRDSSSDLVFIAMNHPSSEMTNRDNRIEINTDVYTFPLKDVLKLGFVLDDDVTVMNVDKHAMLRTRGPVGDLMALSEGFNPGPYQKILIINLHYQKN